MESKDIQTKELSKKTGISENTIKTYLRSASVEPKLSKAIILAKALGVSVEFLATGLENNSDFPKSKEALYILQEIKHLSERDLKIIVSAIGAMN